MHLRLFNAINANPLRFAWGLSLSLVGLTRFDLLLPLDSVHVEPFWLYGGLQCLAGLGLLLTLTHHLTWYGRLAIILAIAVSGMLVEALWQQGSAGALIYLVMTGMLLTRLAHHD